MSLAYAKRGAAPVDLCDLSFDHSFVRELPADPLLTNVPRAVRNACYTRVDPTPVSAPRLLGWADAVGEMLGISRPDTPAGSVAEVLAGNRVLPGMQPYAARYGGHQFGQWAGQLGDGRAITLAEVVSPDGMRQELQLKGAGTTPYSRTADGRSGAALLGARVSVQRGHASSRRADHPCAEPSGATTSRECGRIKAACLRPNASSA